MFSTHIPQTHRDAVHIECAHSLMLNSCLVLSHFLQAVGDQRLIYGGKLLPDHLHIKDLFRQVCVSV